MKHYMEIVANTDFSYGPERNKWKETLCTKFRLGVKYYWELGVNVTEEEKQCRLCGAERAHTLQHYILICPIVATYRNKNIDNFTKQLIWMFNNGKVNQMLQKLNAMKKLL